MEDIEIRRRRGSIFAPVVGALVLVILVAIGIAQLLRRDEAPLAIADDPAETEAPPARREPAAPAPDRAAVTAPEEVAPRPDWARAGAERLAASLERLVARDETPGLRERAQILRRHIGGMRATDPRAPEHAAQARAAFSAAVDVMDELRRRPPLQDVRELDLQVETARAAAEEVHPERPLTEQPSEVQAFFERMGAAIRTAERHQVD